MILKLANELTLRGAAAQKDVFLEALRADPVIRLDASGVEDIDLSGLQLLCALHRSAANAGKTVELCEGARPEVIDEAARKAGFDRHSGCAPGCLWTGCPRG